MPPPIPYHSAAVQSPLLRRMVRRDRTFIEIHRRISKTPPKNAKWSNFDPRPPYSVNARHYYRLEESCMRICADTTIECSFCRRNACESSCLLENEFSRSIFNRQPPNSAHGCSTFLLTRGNIIVANPSSDRPGRCLQDGVITVMLGSEG